MMGLSTLAFLICRMTVKDLSKEKEACEFPSLFYLTPKILFRNGTLIQAYMDAAHHITFPVMTNMERNGSSGIISCMGKQYVSMLGIQISINEYLPRNANTLFVILHLLLISLEMM